MPKEMLTDRAIMGACCALCLAWAGGAAAQSDRAGGILTGEERAQYEASLAFCREEANRDRVRCKRFERAFPGALPARASPAEAEASEAAAE